MQRQVASALWDGMSRDVRFLADATGLDAKQVQTALYGLHASLRVARMPDGYWCISPRGRQWLEVRDA